MKGSDGSQHGDEEPITWREFCREMQHRDQLETERRLSLQKAIDLRAAQLLSSHRILVAVLAALAIVVQLVLFFRK